MDGRGRAIGAAEPERPIRKWRICEAPWSGLRVVAPPGLAVAVGSPVASPAPAASTPPVCGGVEGAEGGEVFAFAAPPPEKFALHPLSGICV